MTLVDAESALEGFKAIIADERFNYYLFLLIVALFVAVVVPVSVLDPQKTAKTLIQCAPHIHTNNYA